MIGALSQILKNPIFGGGALLMGAGGIVASLRNIPGRIARWLENQFTCQVEINSGTSVFEWITHWLGQQDYMKRARRVAVVTKLGSATPLFFPAVGTHWFFYKKRIMWFVHHEDTEAKLATNTYDSFNLSKAKTYHIRVLGRSPQIIYRLIEEAKQLSQCAARKPHFRRFNRSYWDDAGLVNRTKASVILPKDAMNIFEDVNTFLSEEAWYEKIGIPYHRGYLMEGTPGSGKTSLACALAKELNRDLYVYNLASKMTDDGFANAIADIPSKSILLLEDIDCVGFTAKRKSKDKKDKEALLGISLTAFLNVMDGSLSNHGLVTIMTTNHRENLDPAILRPGRVDAEIHFGYATEDQAFELFRRFFPDSPKAEDFSKLVSRSEITMASIQNILLENRTNEEASIKTLSLLSTKSVRERIHERQEGKCLDCGKNITLAQMHCHEKMFRGKGGKISLTNSIGLCYSCHIDGRHTNRKLKWKKGIKKT